MERYIRDRIASRERLTLQQFADKCDRGEVPGLEPFAELKELWNETD